jgi:hypothetical protein
MKPHAMAATAGALTLAATAAFHATGYASVMKAASAGDLDPQIRMILGPLWIFPSAHWSFIAVVALLAAFAAQGRLLLALCGAIIAADAIILYLNLGPFIGEAMLAASALLFLAAAALKSGAR